MTATPDAPQPIEIVLPIEGMTCASCVNRIERFLKKTPGVEQAAVNLATERATVLVDPGTAGRDELVRAVEAAGYEVRPEAACHRRDGRGGVRRRADRRRTGERERAQRTTLIQAVVSIAAALVFMTLMFVPQTRIAMEDLNKLILWPATFIQFWAGGRFYRAAWRAGAARRHDDGHAGRARDDRRLGATPCSSRCGPRWSTRRASTPRRTSTARRSSSA